MSSVLALGKTAVWLNAKQVLKVKDNLTAVIVLTDCGSSCFVVMFLVFKLRKNATIISCAKQQNTVIFH